MKNGVAFYRRRKRVSLAAQYRSLEPGRGVNMESPAAGAAEPPWNEERFLVMTASVAAAAIATDALVMKSRRLSVELFSTLSAMVASCTWRRNSCLETLKIAID